MDPGARVDLYARDPNVVKREEDDDGALLFHPDRDLVKVINATGLFIFDRLDGRTTLGALTRELAAEFDVDEATAARDASAFVEDLVRCGLAVASPER